ncbi:MAG: dihydropteroate synthase [Halothiobacillus sp.]
MLHANHPLIMAILNVTPDSFSDGGLFYCSEKLNVARAIDEAALMLAEGADLIDIGGESTRPGAAPVSADEELARVIPVIEALQQRFDVPLSVDTSQPAVMTAAVHAGASLINDVRALTRDGALAAVKQLVLTHGVAVCLMHMRGEPDTMNERAIYQDVLREVTEELGARVTEVVAAGIPRAHLLLDPGFGFAKNTAQNLLLLKNLEALNELGLPLLVGLSRKRMIGDVIGRPVSERQVGSVVAAVMAMARGARIVRVHDVAATRDGVRLFMALQSV